MQKTLIFVIILLGRDMVEDKGIVINYIRSEYNPVDIMTKNILEADLENHMKIITEGELWELVDTGSENDKNNRVKDDVITFENN